MEFDLLKDNMERLANLTANNVMHTQEPLILACFEVIAYNVEDSAHELELTSVSLLWEIKGYSLIDISLQISQDGDNWLTVDTMTLQYMVDTYLSVCKKEHKEINETYKALRNE